jgi:hypothetical protein
MSVCPNETFTFSLLDGGFTSKQLLPAEKGEQQQEAQSFCIENVPHWHPFLSRGDNSETFKKWYLVYLTWRFQFWGRKRPQTLLSVNLTDSHLVE